MSPLTLGIDLGTTSVKVVIVCKETQQILANQSKDTQANVPSDLGIEGNKQDVPKILSALHNCISRLPKDYLKQVSFYIVCFINIFKSFTFQDYVMLTVSVTGTQ